MTVSTLDQLALIFWYSNSFLLFSGAALLAFSIMWSLMDHYDELIKLEEKLELTSHPNWMLLVALANLIAAYGGYLYVMSKQKMFFLLNLMMITMALGIEVRNYQRLLKKVVEVQEAVSLVFKDQIKWYHKYGENGPLNGIQIHFQCCGWRNEMDYGSTHIPLSCCSKNDTSFEFCKPSNAYKRSCTLIVTDHFLYFLQIALTLYQMCSIIGLGCLLITILIYHLISNNIRN